jgi:plasmid maintenance system antidote protein VapI
MKKDEGFMKEICTGQKIINDADTDLRLCKFFGLSEGYFLRLQVSYDTMEAKRALKNEIESIPNFQTFL